MAAATSTPPEEEPVVEALGAVAPLPEPPLAASVVVASEELDGESGWRMLEPGELVHVRPDLSISSAVVLTEPPARLVPLPADNPNVDT